MESRHFAWLAAFAALGLAGSANAQVVQGVQVDPSGAGMVVLVKGKGLAAPTVSRRGHVLDLDFDASLAGRAQRIAPRKAGLQWVRAGWLSSRPRRVRVRLDLTPGTKAQTGHDARGWTLAIGEVASPVAKAAPTVKPKPAEPTRVAVKPAGDGLPPVEGLAPIPLPHAKESRVESPKAPTEVLRRVNLECSNADVVQILKGLALQTGANLVIGSDVKGTVTVNLHDVTVDQALDYVSSMAAIRYAKIDGDTYLVSSEAGFAKAMDSLAGRSHSVSTVRVVPILSSDVPQVKAAVERSFSPATLRVLGPGEGSLPSAVVPKDGANGAYVVLMGDPQSVDRGERLAHEVDSRILEARTKVRDANGDPATAAQQAAESRVRHTYEVQSGKAAKLKSVLSEQGGAAEVTMFASPEESGKQVLVVEGAPKSVDRTLELLKQLDTGSAGDEILVYDVKYADPRSLRESLISEVQGLRATLAPNNVGNTGVYVEGKTKTQASEITDRTVVTSTPTSTGGLAAGGSGTVGTVSTKNVDDADLEQPFGTQEKVAVPMRLILRGTRGELDEALRFLAAIDVAPKQVALELRVMELSKDDALKAGIDWNVLGGGAVKFLRLNNAQDAAANGVGVGFSGRDFTGDVTATLDRIANSNNLVARPNVVALDGRQTEIFVGDIVRYIESIVNSQNGTTVTTGEVPVGVRLSVLPRVGAGGVLTMDIRPRISLLKGYTPVPGGGQLPQTSSRFAQSTITVESGQTIAIGGLIQDQDVLNVQGLPFLMDLPIVGHLFKRTTKTKYRTELVVFLTARTIDGPVRTGDTTLPMQGESKLAKKVQP